MINEILIFSRDDAEDYAQEKHSKDSAVISIKSTFDPSTPKIFSSEENHIKKVIFTTFNDAWTEREGCMTLDDAFRIAEFVKEINEEDIPRLVVHCDAGESRSAGIAAAISEYLFQTGDEILHKYPANQTCYSLLLDALEQ